MKFKAVLLGCLGIIFGAFLCEASVVVTAPVPNEFTFNQKVMVGGRVSPNVAVFVNGAQVFVRSDFQFEYELELGMGENSVVISYMDVDRILKHRMFRVYRLSLPKTTSQFKDISAYGFLFNTPFVAPWVWAKGPTQLLNRGDLAYTAVQILSPTSSVMTPASALSLALSKQLMTGYPDGELGVSKPVDRVELVSALLLAKGVSINEGVAPQASLASHYFKLAREHQIGGDPLQYAQKEITVESFLTMMSASPWVSAYLEGLKTMRVSDTEKLGQVTGVITSHLARVSKQLSNGEFFLEFPTSTHRISLTPTLLVQGYVNPKFPISANNRRIDTDPLGHFRGEFPLKEGVNRLMLTTSKRSQEVVVMYLPPYEDAVLDAHAELLAKLRFLQFTPSDARFLPAQLLTEDDALILSAGFIRAHQSVSFSEINHALFRGQTSSTSMVTGALQASILVAIYEALYPEFKVDVSLNEAFQFKELPPSDPLYPIVVKAVRYQLISSELDLTQPVTRLDWVTGLAKLPLIKQKLAQLTPK